VTRNNWREADKCIAVRTRVTYMGVLRWCPNFNSLRISEKILTVGHYRALL